MCSIKELNSDRGKKSYGAHTVNPSQHVSYKKQKILNLIQTESL